MKKNTKLKLLKGGKDNHNFKLGLNEIKIFLFMSAVILITTSFVVLFSAAMIFKSLIN